MGSFSVWHWLIVILFMFVPLFFLPSIVAFTRHHQNRFAICLVNLILGVTGIGWVVAMVWALTQVTPRRERQ